jgi:hypothetical protein
MAPKRAKFKGGQVEFLFAKCPKSPYSPVQLGYNSANFIGISSRLFDQSTNRALTNKNQNIHIIVLGPS